MKLGKKDELRAKKLHERCLVFDMHSDIPCELVRRRYYGETHILNNVFYNQLKNGGVDAVWMSTMPHVMNFPLHKGDYLQGGMNCIDVMLSELEECRDHFELAKNAGEVIDVRKKGKIAVLMGFEGSEPLDENIRFLRNFFRLGLREVQLTWNFSNAVCDGIYEKRNAGLTEFGVSLVKEMNRLGMLIDTSHINSKGLEDVLDVSDQPIYMSHTSSRNLIEHQRNITDDQAKAIAQKGGVIGVCFLPQFVSKGRATIEDVLDHIDHFVKVIGSEHVGLGPDFIDYCLEVMQAALKGSAYESGETFRYPQDIEDASKLVNITRGLVKRGYSDIDIENILGMSMLRLIEKVIG